MFENREQNNSMHPLASIYVDCNYYWTSKITIEMLTERLLKYIEIKCVAWQTYRTSSTSSDKSVGSTRPPRHDLFTTALNKIYFFAIKLSIERFILTALSEK